MKSLDGILTTPPTELDMWNRWRLRFHRNLVEKRSTKIWIKQFTDRECVVCRKEFLALNNMYHCSEQCDERGAIQSDNALQEQ